MCLTCSNQEVVLILELFQMTACFPPGIKFYPHPTMQVSLPSHPLMQATVHAPSLRPQVSRGNGRQRCAGGARVWTDRYSPRLPPSNLLERGGGKRAAAAAVAFMLLDRSLSQSRQQQTNEVKNHRLRCSRCEKLRFARALK